MIVSQGRHQSEEDAQMLDLANGIPAHVSEAMERLSVGHNGVQGWFAKGLAGGSVGGAHYNTGGWSSDFSQSEARDKQ
jgi:hypothetical protein